MCFGVTQILYSKSRGVSPLFKDEDFRPEPFHACTPQSLASPQDSPFGGSDLEFVWSLFHICEFPSTTFETDNGLCKGWSDDSRLFQLQEAAS